MIYSNFGDRPRNPADNIDQPGNINPIYSRSVRLVRTAAAALTAALLLISHAAHAGSAKHHTTKTAEAPDPSGAPDEVALASGNWQQNGTASYYGPRHNGHRAADGSTFHQDELTAAHPWLPFGTRVMVTVQETGKQVIVTITDRMPARRRIIDLSLAAARELGILHNGVARVVLAAM
jgi:rare lipoprotein A